MSHFILVRKARKKLQKVLESEKKKTKIWHELSEKEAERKRKLHLKSQLRIFYDPAIQSFTMVAVSFSGFRLGYSNGNVLAATTRLDWLPRPIILVLLFYLCISLVWRKKYTFTHYLYQCVLSPQLSELKHQY